MKNYVLILMVYTVYPREFLGTLINYCHVCMFKMFNCSIMNKFVHTWQQFIKEKGVLHTLRTLKERESSRISLLDRRCSNISHVFSNIHATV